MDSKNKNLNIFEKQFEELFEKAKDIYPNIDDYVSTLNNITAQTSNFQDYLNLTSQTPNEISNNQILIA